MWGRSPREKAHPLCSAEFQTGYDVVSLIGLKAGILIKMDIQDAEVIAPRKELGTVVIGETLCVCGYSR